MTEKEELHNEHYYDKERNMPTEKALRYNTGKSQWSLVDFESLKDMVEVLEFGANKYEAHNWKKGHYTTKLCESLMRHLFAFLGGEDVDPESGCSHIGHIQCNAMFLAHSMKHHSHLDDRYKENNNQKNK